MNTKQTYKLALAILSCFSSLAIAGTEKPIVTTIPSDTNPGNFCEWLEGKPGTIHKDKENPFVQELQLMGRLQYQAAYVDGSNSDPNAGDWSEGYDEYRRVRLGVKMKFLQYFGLKYQLNLVSDGRPSGRELDWGYKDIDEAFLTFDLNKALNADFDKLSLVYGRQKFVFSQEDHMSSTKIVTIERSAISNKVYGSYRPTGLTLKGEKGAFSFDTSFYSSTTDGDDNGEFNGWDDSQIYLANLGYQVSDELFLRASYVYNDADVSDGDDSVMGYAWATSLAAEYDAGKWGINANVIYGDNGDGRLGNSANRDGEFWGFVATPYYWILEEKLQLVGQYQYQGANSSEGIRINSRYGRRDGNTLAEGGRGDSHHSVYGGLNYYICSHNAKFMAGIEYQTMDAPSGDFDTLTYLLAFRSYF